MIAYVRPDSTLMIGAGIPASWLQDGGLTVRDLPIGQGRIDIRMTAEGIALTGSLRVPPGGILVRNPASNAVVRVNRLPWEKKWAP
jgi:hypothetical protein